MVEGTLGRSFPSHERDGSSHGTPHTGLVVCTQLVLDLRSLALRFPRLALNLLGLYSIGHDSLSNVCLCPQSRKSEEGERSTSLRASIRDWTLRSFRQNYVKTTF